MIKLNRVVVTGMGIVSPIGNNVNEVKDSLINTKSGIFIHLFMKKWDLEVKFMEQLN